VGRTSARPALVGLERFRSRTHVRRKYPATGLSLTVAERAQSSGGLSFFENCSWHRATVRGSARGIISIRNRRWTVKSVDHAAFYQLKILLQGVLARGTARAIAGLSPYVAGKTGTSDDENDAWFVGFTNDVTVAVWIGSITPTASAARSGAARREAMSQFLYLSR